MGLRYHLGETLIQAYICLEGVPAVFEVRLGGTLDGYKQIQATGNYPSETLGRIPDGGQFFVEQQGADYWLVRDRATKISGFIYANHEIISIYR